MRSTETNLSATKTNCVPVLAIDGPSGSGKGTISLAVARQLGWHYLDSGALYRVLGHIATRNDIDLADEVGLTGLVDDLNDDRNDALEIEFLDGAVWLCGEEVGDEIRTEEAGRRASMVAPIRGVRAKLLVWQRGRAQMPGLVADGRDMGTVVFPNATCKIFLTASAQARAQRRFRQLRDKGFDVTMARLFKEISERDARDANRAVSPLKPAADAVVLDTTNLTIEVVVSQALALVRDATDK